MIIFPPFKKPDGWRWMTIDERARVFREDRQCGMGEAREYVLREQIELHIANAVDVADLRSVLEMLLPYINLSREPRP